MLLRPPAAADVVQALAPATPEMPAVAAGAGAWAQHARTAPATPWELAEPVRLTRFVARRLAKTAILDPLRDPAHATTTEGVLARIAAYVAAAGTTFGRGDWNPPVDPQGTMVREADPHTGAQLIVACTSRAPLRFSATVEVPELGTLSWEEVAEGQRLGLGCVTVPVAVEATFAGARGGPLAGYVATVAGRLTARVSPRLGPWVVRASAELTAHDSCAGIGRIELEPTGALRGRFIAADGAAATVGGAVSAPEIVPALGEVPAVTRLAA